MSIFNNIITALKKVDYHGSANVKTQKSIQTQVISKGLPQAITITEMYNLDDYFGKFVKLAVTNLENYDTFRLRYLDLSRRVSAEEAKLILSKPLTELQYTTMRGIFRVKIEPISVIPAHSYEESHCIYGILRRKPNGDYVLNNAFVRLSDNHLLVVAQALKTQGMFEYSVLDDGTISVFNFTSDSVEDLEIPEKIDGMIVSAISRYAFARNQVIKSLKIPKTVKSLDYGAFSGCSNLETVFLGDGVETLNVAFDVCGKLKKVYIGKALSKVNDSFHNCHKLKAFDVDADCEHLCEIDGVLFSKDKNILVFCPCGKKGKYVIPSGTQIIGESAFENTDLEEIVIPNTVKKIEYDAFGWAGDIKRIIIPNSVKEIAPEAISAGIGEFEGEIVIEKGSYAQQYFQNSYKDDYNLVILDKSQMEEIVALKSIDVSDKLFCRRCGTQLSLDSDFCFKCGTKVKKDIV